MEKRIKFLDPKLNNEVPKSIINNSLRSLQHLEYKQIRSYMK